ncbi:transcriptional regulator, AraC family [Candidatus Moduliflexus flocculans]|uniref:Transcriptional regulator, AraC family n=1 Tax=Candidatus Moduliflexus flocculans TaxID=1499966 RepID=A0A0S6VRP6_9BACT|nr:transcriptional regulator, AraC family [Candidatus Moduliflexus flocculans]
MIQQLVIFMAVFAFFVSALFTQAQEFLSNATFMIKELPEYQLAYVEQVGDFEGNGEIYDVLIERLVAWALPKNLWDFPATTKMILVYPDDPETTPQAQQRLWLGITVPEDMSTPEGIQKLALPRATYAVGTFEISAQEFGSAWGYMYEWISRQNYSVAEGYRFEVKKNDSDAHPEKKHLVDICIPVRSNN